MNEDSFRNFWYLVTDVWNDGLYGINISEILIAATVLIGFLLLRNIFTVLVINRIQRIADKTENKIDDTIVKALEKPIRFIPIVMGVFFATNSLDLSETSTVYAAMLNRSLIAFVIFWSLYRASEPVSILLQHADQYLTASMIQWIAKTIKLMFAILGAATILEIWGIQVGPLIAGLGLFGVAVALGAQDLFKNLIAGLFVIGEKRFNPGDWILVDGIVEGTVEHIGFRTTTVRRFDKAPVYVPNASLSDNSVTNFSRMTYRRIKWGLGIRYDANAEQLSQIRKAIEDYLKNSEKFVQPHDTATFVRIDGFGASSVDILLYAFTKTTNWLEWLEVKEELLLAVKSIVADAGTDFAYPSQSLYVEALGPDTVKSETSQPLGF